MKHTADVAVDRTPTLAGPAIDRRDSLSYADFEREYLYPLKPVVVRGALSKWKALERWTPEFFRSEFPDKKFTIQDKEYGQAGYREGGGVEFAMPEFIDRVLASTNERPAPYLRNRILSEMFPTLTADIEPIPEYFFPNWLGDKYAVKQLGSILNRGNAIEIYIGGEGGAFPVLHYDGAGTHAFLAQIYGRKEYVVYAPDQEHYLYPSPTKVNHSLVNSVETPDLEKFPLFAKAARTTFLLEPGELLFVPAHWWHTAKILTPSITISANVLNGSNWPELERYVALKQRNPLVSFASQLYLKGAGAKRSRRDRSPMGQRAETGR